ncbi:MAG: hypothetical protein JO091_14230, partial [Acidobacteriaceae bacterium]|nr:hypothetical protein [Acidobacteriaceae bacterium]
IAMPWYVHNLFLYDSFSATQQSVAGVGLRQAVSALTRINWLASAAEFALWSLWTGNWSFTAFSRNTLNFELLLLLAALATYVAQFRRMPQAELWVLAACGCFLLGLIYQTCVTWVHTHGVSTHPEPWYGQGVIACLWVLCAMGLETANVAGRIVAIALCLVSAWIAELTYVAKLLPYYGGMHARSTWHTVWNWWQANPEHALQAIVLAPVPMVYALLGAFSIMLAAVTALAVYRLRRS